MWSRRSSGCRSRFLSQGFSGDGSRFQPKAARWAIRGRQAHCDGPRHPRLAHASYTSPRQCPQAHPACASLWLCHLGHTPDVAGRGALSGTAGRHARLERHWHRWLERAVAVFRGFQGVLRKTRQYNSYGYVADCTSSFWQCFVLLPLPGT